MKVFKIALLLAFGILASSTSAPAQAVHCSGFWVLYGVPLTEQDSHALLEALAQADPHLYRITHNNGTDLTTYGQLEMESVTLLEGGIYETDTELCANWFFDMRITPLFFSSKAIKYESSPSVDPNVEAQVFEILSRYSDNSNQ